MSKNKKFLPQVVKFLKLGTVFDSQLKEDAIKNTKTVTSNDIYKHITEKKRLSEEEIEAIKLAARINKNIQF